MTRQSWLSSWCVLVTLTSYLGAVQAASVKICNPQDPTKCSQPLNEGDEAPFAGQLLTTDLAIELGQRADGCDQRLKLSLDYQQRITNLELDYTKKSQALQLETMQTKVDLLQKQLEVATATPWYKSPLFVASVSIIATVGVFLSAGYIIDKVNGSVD